MRNGTATVPSGSAPGRAVLASRPMRRTPIGIALAVALAVIGAAGAGTTAKSFANGRWSGSSHLAQTLEGFKLTGNATFSFQVQRGRVASGTLLANGSARGTTQGQTVTVTIKGRIPLSGPAAGPTGRGKLNVAVQLGGENQTGSSVVIYTFTGLRGTCDRMTGQIVRRLAEVPAGTDTSSTSAPFVATRAAGSGPRC